VSASIKIEGIFIVCTQCVQACGIGTPPVKECVSSFQLHARGIEILSCKGRKKKDMEEYCVK